MRYLGTLWLLLFLLPAYAQTKADSISQVFPKIIVLNDKQEILLSFDSNRKAFEVPSIGTLDGPVSIKTHLDQVAAELGFIYSSFRMGGLFTYIFPNRYRTFIRPYFVVKFKGYKDGHALRDSSCKWFPVSAAIKMIPYPASALIVQDIIKHPRNVRAATFEEYGYTNPLDTSKIRFRQLEDFYNLDASL
ncbi:hypothetical protein [Chitinophaga arvensicola]|uniref:Uncharacterized protein n=1 Tax=Chitinophaga arvensicola TaxID=29529 RepID=A0A1I0QXK8_9BACT|nr:hypothetical protein [Chitinophaga arvensicola]SEW32556.1 hypothetical protein SAMN04488122_1875 [Chitinophaga arvensicola]